MNTTPTDSRKLIALGIVMLAGLFAGIFLVQKGQDIRGRASETKVRLVLSPNQSTLPVTLKMFLDPGTERVGFVDVVVTFPKDQLAFLGAGTTLGHIMSISSVSEVAGQSGSTGKIRIAAGVNPDVGSIKAYTEIATLTFDKATDVVSPTTDNVTFIDAESHVFALPEKELGIKTFGTRLLTVRPTGENQAKKRKAGDLGLILSVKQRADGKDIIEANWIEVDVLDKPNFLNFSIAIRTAAGEPALGGDDRRVEDGVFSKTFSDVSTLPAGEYFVHLRAMFKDRIVPQEPRQSFMVDETGHVILK